MKAARWVVACGVCLLLAGCHDYHGTVRMVDGHPYIDFGGFMQPNFSCAPGSDVPWQLSQEQRDDMCDYANDQLPKCKSKSGSFGLSLNDDGSVDEGNSAFICDTTDPHDD